MSTDTRKYGLYLTLILIGAALGVLGQRYFDPTFSTNGFEVRGIHGYTYINPLLECDIGSEYISRNSIADFKPEIEKLIEDEKDNGNITYAAVYFRDLNSGPWFGINEEDDFRPASLLKVPIMMNIYKAEEESPGILARKVVYDGSDLNLEQDIEPEKHVEIGKAYTVEELIGYMIKYSDNRAAAMLLKVSDSNKFIELLKMIGITIPVEARSQEDFVSLRQYVAFFRILYNASYNTDDFSEKELKLLTETTYSSGLKAGLPPDIKVAHKFGETLNTVTGENQLHDCGIVYYPKKPYLLCVSTRGKNFIGMEKTIADISRAAYYAVDEQMKRGN